jgi:hypothetical protein
MESLHDKFNIVITSEKHEILSQLYFYRIIFFFEQNELQPHTAKFEKIGAISRTVTNMYFVLQKLHVSVITFLSVFGTRKISCVHLNVSSKLAFESRLRTHHSCKSVDLNSWFVLLFYAYSAFTIKSPTPTLRTHSNERTIS